MNKLAGLVKQSLVVIVLLGAAAYAILLLLYAFGVKVAAMTLESAPAAYMFGLPIAAFIAFAIVAILDKGRDGTQQFTAFSLRFDGPVSPVALWVICYLTVVFSIWIVSNLY
jgi:hypothetical protein